MMRRYFCRYIAIVFIHVATALPGHAQGNAATALQAEAAKFGCSVNLASNQDIRCCLALLDSRALTGDASPVRDEARALEARLLGVLAGRGASDQPRICPTPTSYPPWYRWPTSRIVDELRPGLRGVADSLAPRYEFSLNFGQTLNGNNQRVPTGGATYQDFPLVAGSDGTLDIRLAWLLAGAARGDSGLPGQLALYAGYSLSQSHIDRVLNSGGGVNTVFEGSLVQRRPYFGASYTFAVLGGVSSVSLPAAEGFVGANIGYSSVRLSDDAGPFQVRSQGWDYGAEVGLNFRLQDNWLVSPSISATFDTPGLDESHYRFNIGLKRRF